MEGETVRAKWCILAVVVRGKNKKKKKERKLLGKKRYPNRGFLVKRSFDSNTRQLRCLCWAAPTEMHFWVRQRRSEMEWNSKRAWDSKAKTPHFQTDFNDGSPKTIIDLQFQWCFFFITTIEMLLLFTKMSPQFLRRQFWLNHHWINVVKTYFCSNVIYIK